MAAKVRRGVPEWTYTAHILHDDATVTEISGGMHAWSQGSVYQHVSARAQELGGIITGCHIVEKFIDDDDPVTRYLPAPKEEEKVEPKWYDCRDAFGAYISSYKGASLCTYKVVEEP